MYEVEKHISEERRAKAESATGGHTGVPPQPGGSGTVNIETPSSGENQGNQGATLQNVNQTLTEPGVSPTTTIVDSAANLQREFKTLQDSLSRVRLPEELKLVDSKQGIKGKDQPMLHVISQSARYTETALKIIATQPEDVASLYVVLSAHMNFLHGEYAGLLVGNTFDQDTAKVFKCLEKNTFAFKGSALTNLRNAAEITAVRSQVQAQQSPPNYTWQGYRGRGRGFQSGNRGFGRQQNPGGDRYRQFNRGANFNQIPRSSGGNTTAGGGDD